MKLEVTFVYQDRQITLTRPETKYGSNLDSFSELVGLAFQGIGLTFNGEITEMQNGDK